MQVEWKWCGGLRKDNLKHKLYMACSLWKESPLPSLYYNFYLFVGIKSKCHFSPKVPSGSPKIWTLVVPKLWMFISFLNEFLKKNARVISYSLKKLQQCITHFNRTSFDTFFQGICGQKLNFQFDSHLFF